MARAQPARRFFLDRWIVTDKSSNRGSRGDEMNTDPPSHTVADGSDARRINISTAGQVTPADVDGADEFFIRFYILNLLLASKGAGQFSEAKQTVKLRHDCAVAQLGKFIGLRSQVSDCP